MGKDPHGRCFFFLGGKSLRDIKTRERRDGAELPKTLRHAPKELAQKGLRAAKEKGKEQLQQAAQNGIGGAEQAAPEESAGDQLLGRAEEWGGTVTAGGRDMLRRIPAARMRAGVRTGWRSSGAMHLAVRRPAGALFQGKSTCKFHAQQGEAHVLKTGRPAVKAARQPVKTPPAIHAAKQQAAHTAKQAAQRAKRAARVAQQAVKSAGRAIANTARAVSRQSKTFVAVLAAGGGLALFIVLLICVIALVAGSAFGIFFSSEPTGKGMTLKQAVQILNEEYYQKLKEIEAEIPHDQVEYISEDGSVSIHWEDILAVFAADMAADEYGQQIVALDDGQLEQLRAVLSDMHQISHSTRTVKHEEEIIITDEDGSEVTEWVTVSETILKIKVSHKTAAEMAEAYGFTPRQDEQLALLADPQYDALWMELLGGYVSGGGQIIDPDTDWTGTGIFAWPLPQSFTITSNFGYRQDPFTGKLTYHNGTDIAAPQHAILAAAAAL